MPAPREEMRIVAEGLTPLGVPFAFIGWAVMCVLVDYPEVTQFRRTKDVDVVVAVVSYAEYVAFEEKLRSEGFTHDASAGAPICRWIVDGCRVDIMPQGTARLGMSTRWFAECLAFALERNLGHGCTARIVTPPLFLATKLEAFNDRGKSDYYLSHDLEDILTLVDGRASIVQDVQQTRTDIRQFVSAEFTQIAAHPDFGDALHGHVAEKQRIPIVKTRFDAIAALRST